MDKKQNFTMRDISSAGVFSYIAAICSLPVSGIFSTLPMVAVCSIASVFLSKTYTFTYLLFGLMPLLLNCLYGFELSRALFFAVIYIITVYCAILLKRAIITIKYSKKNQKAEMQLKSTAVAMLCVIALIALWLISSGNPVSAILSSSKNKNYIAETYSDTVSTGYTYYDYAKKDYLTEIEFEGMESGKVYYVAYPDYDGYSEYCAELISLDARDYFEGRTTLDADSILCYADISGLSVTPQDDFTNYYDRCEYLYRITSEIPGITGFKGIYRNLTPYLTLSDTFVYKSITIAGTDMDGNVYYAYLPFGGEVEYYYNDTVFEKIIEDKFGNNN